MSTLQRMTEKASAISGEARQSIEDAGRSAASALDEARGQTSAALHSAASSVRSTGVEGSQAIDRITSGAADRLDATASFVEEHDLKCAVTSVRRFGLRHLAGSLVAAAAVGFLAGSAFSRAAHACGKRT